MKKRVFAIRTSDGFWYYGHDKKCSSVWKHGGHLPKISFDTKEEASSKIDEIVRDLPNEGVDCSIVSICFTTRTVYV